MAFRHPLYFAFSVTERQDQKTLLTRLFFAFPSCVSFGAIERRILRNQLH